MTLIWWNRYFCGIIKMDVEESIEYLNQEISEVSRLIEDNKRLQEKYPERKRELELGLQSLYDLRNEMSDALFRMNYKKAYGDDVNG